MQRTSTPLNALDSLICRLLFVNRETDERPEVDRRGENAFGLSLMFSGVRCVLQYAILPFVLPIIGIASAAATPITFALTLVAFISLIYSLRRLWRINYARKWQYLAFALVVFAILFAFMIMELQAGLA